MLMSFRFLILNLLIQVCFFSSLSSESFALPTSASQPTLRKVDSFRFIGAATTLKDVTIKLGAPDRDIGSGIYIYQYRLSDGSNVFIGSADGSHILYVIHGQHILFKRR
jgi:hypothetical protein